MKCALGLEVANGYLAIGLWGDAGFSREKLLQLERGHAEYLLPEIISLLGEEKKNLVAIGVTRGPGSFSGIRIGLATAQALSFGLELPVYSFSSLEIYGYVSTLRPYLVLLSTRNTQVYAVLYGTQGEMVWPQQSYAWPDLLLKLRDLAIPVTVTGPGVFRYAASLRELTHVQVDETRYCLPSGVEVARLAYQAKKEGQADEQMALTPLYL